MKEGKRALDSARRRGEAQFGQDPPGAGGDLENHKEGSNWSLTVSFSWT